MRVHRLGSLTDAAALMQRLDVDTPGINIMAKKSQIMLFLIKDLHVGAANILKQDALSVGADFAVPNGTITCQFKRVDGLLIGTRKHMEILAKKELAQPYGLKELARELRRHLGKKRCSLQIMGIINANEESFYPQSRFMGARAIEAIERMIEEGADIIDIGGMSTRPGSEEISPQEELAHIKPIVDEIARRSWSVRFSIDTYRPEVARYALERGFAIVNDITGLASDEMAEVVAEFGAQIVIMHKKGDPKTMQQNPHYDDVIAEVERFFEERIAKAHSWGIEDIVLDPGIGFGKRLEDNIALIKHLSHFHRFGLPLLIGVSRKSMIDKIAPSAVEERLAGTLALHGAAVQEGACIVRCHDVKEHKQYFSILQRLKSEP